MTTLIIISTLIAISALAQPFGADSRSLRPSPSLATPRR